MAEQAQPRPQPRPQQSNSFDEITAARSTGSAGSNSTGGRSSDAARRPPRPPPPPPSSSVLKSLSQKTACPLFVGSSSPSSSIIEAAVGGDADGPADLVPVESSSESDDSSSSTTSTTCKGEEDDDDETTTIDQVMMRIESRIVDHQEQQDGVAASSSREKQQHHPLPPKTPSSTTTSTEESSLCLLGGFPMNNFCCLADHITSVFCPVDTKSALSASPAVSTVDLQKSASSTSTSASASYDAQMKAATAVAAVALMDINATPSPSCCHPHAVVAASCAPDLPPLYEYLEGASREEANKSVSCGLAAAATSQQQHGLSSDPNEMDDSIFSLNFWGPSEQEEEQQRRARALQKSLRLLMMWEEEEQKLSTITNPRNRSRYGRGQLKKHRYIAKLYDSWHTPVMPSEETEITATPDPSEHSEHNNEDLVDFGAAPTPQISNVMIDTEVPPPPEIPPPSPFRHDHHHHHHHRPCQSEQFTSTRRSGFSNQNHQGGGGSGASVVSTQTGQSPSSHRPRRFRLQRRGSNLTTASASLLMTQPQQEVSSRRLYEPAPPSAVRNFNVDDDEDGDDEDLSLIRRSKSFSLVNVSKTSSSTKTRGSGSDRCNRRSSMPFMMISTFDNDGTAAAIDSTTANNRTPSSKSSSKTSFFDSDNDMFYDSDPEQEPMGKRRRRASLLAPSVFPERPVTDGIVDAAAVTAAPPAVPTRTIRLFQRHESSSSTGSFRDRRPTSIEISHSHSHRHDSDENNDADGEETVATSTSTSRAGSTTSAISMTSHQYGGGGDDDDELSSSVVSDVEVVEEDDDGDMQITENHEHMAPPVAPRNGDCIAFDFANAATSPSASNENDDDANGANGSSGLSSRSSSYREITAATNAAVYDSAASQTSSAGSHNYSQRSRPYLKASTTPGQGPQAIRNGLPPRPPSSTDTMNHGLDLASMWAESHLEKDFMDETSKEYAQELSNLRFPLIWHPPPAGRDGGEEDNEDGSADSPTSSPARPSSMRTKTDFIEKNNKERTKTLPPLAVQGVFEVGAHLETAVVQPKFTWSPILQHDMHDQRKLVLSQSAPHSVELLSIIRVNKPAYLDRTKYPFCRLDRTLCITTNDSDHPFVVLEASSPSERDRLVTAVKLIVARLASIIIVRNEEMLLEFFSPYSALLQLEDEDEAEESDDQLGNDFHDGGHKNHVQHQKQSQRQITNVVTNTMKEAMGVVDNDDMPVVDDIKRDTSDQEQSDVDDLREGE
mmetsp:Transcript_54375/g.131979  ORF Transcript_54375/g.131979 Transcript_54375/m.131979 type:complete len:1235 (+) Transcript_54375:429-4133(+)